jgi:hypothetical protein
MALSVGVTACEHSACRVREELQPDKKRHRPAEKGRLLVCREIGDGLEVQRDRFLERAENLLEGAPLHRDVEVEANGFPIAVSPFGIAVKRSRRQLLTLRLPRRAGPTRPACNVNLVPGRAFDN